MTDAPILPVEGRLDPGFGATRLLAAGEHADLAAHLGAYGPLPLDVPLADEIETAGLTGRGGAAFPVARKLRALAGAPGAIIANGSEGEPLSRKDHTLLRHAPHLVLDGLAALARQVEGAPRLIVVAPAELTRPLRAAIAQREDGSRFELSASKHDRFVQGEASAVISALGGGDAAPIDHPEHLTSSGLKNKPTLLYNVETLAHIALIARYGGAWFRAVGDPSDPGTRLVSLSGDGVDPHVREVPSGATLRAILTDGGADLDGVGAVLVGGYHGEWRPASDLDLPVSNARGAAVRAWAGVIQVLRADACGLTVSDGILRYLATQTANQCGPCRFGVPALADEFAAMVAGSADEQRLERMTGLLVDLPGRGACHHPDGSVRFAASALTVFEDEAGLHRRGECSAAASAAEGETR